MLPRKENLDYLTSIAKTISLYDNFGILNAYQTVNMSWMKQPQQLFENIQSFWEQCISIQGQFIKQVMGTQCEDTIEPSPYDERFKETIWETNPMSNLIKENYLLYTHWIQDSIFNAPDCDEKTKRKAAFWSRQVLNALSPKNYFWLNPKAMSLSFESGGKTLYQGYQSLCADIQKRDVTMVKPDNFKVGGNLATTSGKVIYRNELIELIQYEPQTKTVYDKPIVFIPPWINKYYILDINQKKSIFQYLVKQGFTVFTISWKNPTTKMRNTTFENYVLEGAFKAIEVASNVCNKAKVQAVGYCIGGTALSMLMAYLNDCNSKSKIIPIESWTLLCSLADFENPGDIDVFISKETIQHIEKLMKKDGFLDGKVFEQTFRLLRSNSLIWHNVVHQYLYGEEHPEFDLLFWNTDGTRLPEAMHSFYLRELYLKNNLIKKNKIKIDGTPLDLSKIKQPLYVVGTEQDHITPWQEVFKICKLLNSQVRYALATSGHIIGILSPPVTPAKRRYWVGDATQQSDPVAWMNAQEKICGSWWEDWTNWLASQCSEKKIISPSMGNQKYKPIMDAPGSYVFEK